MVGVGPGSPEYLTTIATEILKKSDIVAGFEPSLNTVKHLLAGKSVYVIPFRQQDHILKKIAQECGGKVCAFACTGDPDFSDSEYIQKICQHFGSVEIIPGISSIQIAAAKSGLPIDKSAVFTFHVTEDVESRKRELLDSVEAGKPVILLPRPWNFMPAHIARFLIQNGISESTACRIWENLTLPGERVLTGSLKDMIAREFSDLSVMLIGKGELNIEAQAQPTMVTEDCDIHWSRVLTR